MIAFTSEELAALFRSDVDDELPVAGDDVANLWKINTVYRYMTVAMDALARDAQGLQRVLRLPVVANEPTVPLPRQVLEIYVARLLIDGREVHPANTNDTALTCTSDYGVYHHGFQGMFKSTGTPDYYIRDYQQQALHLMSIPVKDDTLEIQCTVTIAVPVEAGMVLPFREIIDQQLILAHMKFQAYRKQDAETMDMARSDGFYAEYKNGVLARNSELRNYRSTPGQIRMNWP